MIDVCCFILYYSVSNSNYFGNLQLYKNRLTYFYLSYMPEKNDWLSKLDLNDILYFDFKLIKLIVTHVIVQNYQPFSRFFIYFKLFRKLFNSYEVISRCTVFYCPSLDKISINLIRTLFFFVF